MKSIEIRRIFGFIPVPIFWTERTLEDWQGGYSLGVFCVIRPKYRDRKDEGIVRHELRHCEQFYCSPLTHGVRYRLSKKYRLKCEIDSYSEQLRHYTGRVSHLQWMVTAICEKYGLTVARTEAEQALREACSSKGIDLAK